ncbi:MAG: hypothetical protein AAF203_10365 [Pseudomonadota bacterium]
MEFWKVFSEESLQKPWLISKPGNEPIEMDTRSLIPEPSNARVFVYSPGLNEDHLTMVSKMIFALKWKPEQVELLELSLDQMDGLAQWREEKKIIFFGPSFPGSVGEWMNWQGHQIIKTHDLKTLAEQPPLKRDTWEHLKKYASVH